MYRTYRFIADGSGADVAGVTRDLDPQTLTLNRARYGGHDYLMSGPTSARPQPGDGDFGGLGTISRGFFFLDTTLGYVVISDGTNRWLNPSTGAFV